MVKATGFGFSQRICYLHLFRPGFSDISRLKSLMSFKKSAQTSKLCILAQSDIFSSGQTAGRDIREVQTDKERQTRQLKRAVATSNFPLGRAVSFN